MAIAGHDGWAAKTWSRAGIAATVIQSTAASRPTRAAANWLKRVENVLLLKPSNAAAIQFVCLSEGTGFGGSGRLHDDLDTAVGLVAERLIELRAVLKPGPMGNYEGRIDLTLLDALQKLR